MAITSQKKRFMFHSVSSSLAYYLFGMPASAFAKRIKRNGFQVFHTLLTMPKWLFSFLVAIKLLRMHSYVAYLTTHMVFKILRKQQCTWIMSMKNVILRYQHNMSQKSEGIASQVIRWISQKFIIFSPLTSNFELLGHFIRNQIDHDVRNRTAFSPSKSAIQFSVYQGDQIPSSLSPVHAVDNAHQ